VSKKNAEEAAIKNKKRIRSAKIKNKHCNINMPENC
jgi:hypothetical protein